jgi:hypothetical protein
VALGGGVERARGKVALLGPALVAGAIGCVLGAVVLGMNVFAASWDVHAVPKGDLAIVEAHVMRAVRGEQLTGIYSRYGWNHPGPAYFYWLAPFYRLFGPGDGIWIGAAFLAALCLVLSLRAWRALTASPVLLLIWTLLLFGVTFALVTSQLVRFAWTPVVSVFPYLLLISASLAVASGRWWWLSVGLVAHSLLVQTHVAYLLSATGTLGFGLAWGIAAHFGRERSVPRPRLAIAAAHAALLAVLWLPVLLDEARTGPSNLAHVFRFFLAEHPLSGGFTPGATALLAEALSRPLEGLIELFTASPLGNPARRGIATTTALLAPAALIASAQRRSGKGLLLSCAALVQLLLVALGVKGITDQALDYLMYWMSAAAVVPWMAGSHALFERFERPARSWTGLAAVVVVVALAATALASAPRLREPLRWDSDYSRAAQRIADAADARMPARSRVLIEGREGESSSLAILLRRKGHRPTFPGRPAASSADFTLRIGDEDADGVVLGDWQSQIVVFVPPR